MIISVPRSAVPRSAVPYSRLDAVAHGGNPQDRAASLLPTPYSLFPAPFVIRSINQIR
ncbi:hypothetical protein BJP36_40210 [Moorena producens JHB]|uniref:Uncharacterized protein n=1 Tax=Moorena producens (strain JHB) TaxID=1454205 RepID=A0A9Q9UV97_MOOP1|nr:hypothetical protein [Moorena producens]WAN68601.1 hypothetical protein BJP36_40210 [Moorena producens JHB]